MKYNNTLSIIKEEFNYFLVFFINILKVFLKLEFQLVEYLEMVMQLILAEVNF